MSDLSDEFKLSVRSIGEVTGALGSLVNSLAVGRRLRFRGRKPTRAVVVNAAILYLETLTIQERERVLGLGMRRLEAYLNTDDGTPERDGEPAAPPRPVKLTVEDVSPAPRPAVRRAGRQRRG